MSGKLQAATNATLGFLGLNTQEAGVTLESGYATRAINCVIDKSGRLGSRRGWSLLTTTPDGLNTSYVESMFEFIDVDRSITILSAGNGKLFRGTTTLTQLPIKGAESGGVAPDLSPQPTFTGNRWQFAQLAEGAGYDVPMYGFAVQKGNAALVYRRQNHTGAYIFQRIGDYGTKPSGVTTFDPDCVLAAFGRIWTANITGATSTIYYSRLLDGAHYTGTGSGLVDIASVVGNNDEIVGLASHNGFLVVFCRNNIVIYQNPQTPTTTDFALQDVITGVGCIGRDTIQNTGTDLIFMSKSGLRSLNRVISEKSSPMRELSANIRDDLISYLQNETANNIKSVYFEREAFYLLLLPALQQIIYFDLRTQLPNGGARATAWVGLRPKAFLATSDKQLYLGMPGGIATYAGYTDNGSSYRLEYFSQNTDFGSPYALKLLKKAKVIMIATGTQDVILKYGFDYKTTYSARTYAKDFLGASSEYNIAEYNDDNPATQPANPLYYYSSGLAIAEVDLNLGGSGKILQFGIEVPIDGAPVSLQQMTVYVKLGKTV
jgi:hypothetical protein